MYVVCDGYVGFDIRMEVMLVVEEVSKVVVMVVEDDISEFEEGKFFLFDNCGRRMLIDDVVDLIVG